MTAGSRSGERHFLAEGEPAPNGFTVVTGVIKRFKRMANGRYRIVDFLMPCEIIGCGLGDRVYFECSGAMRWPCGESRAATWDCEPLAVIGHMANH